MEEEAEFNQIAETIQNIINSINESKLNNDIKSVMNQRQNLSKIYPRLYELKQKIINYRGISKSKNVINKVDMIGRQYMIVMADDSPDNSDSIEIERQEIDLPEDSRSNNSSMLEATEEEKVIETNTTENEFMQSILYAVIFCILMGVIWTGFI
ncbi:hypothetical protein TVAG_145820 [Trichomonas vaginalis G3]|uniref:Uncharacterized protein n=1 Tax=Trichomonas vaginalis (strain ATCC PRA-98 / G3) TaxID=412133 RepID=A2EFV1_TRIV3|nr:hypothetical protein TVAGG3_0444740 [Trichomonas vaginalis G3]EAY08502.1 hypothetical protein TVAG_145820 [Trichomonas vaginalis G3]KAI5537713.1 hypothetical protein TVAGG3_0444740 [Trichomonas vaginalis G3]|eukprot:XP_001320725.1 hypothetical protein [Trichomonas vaginalis G3]